MNAITTVCYLWAISIVLMLFVFIPKVYFTKQELNLYKEYYDSYVGSFDDICKSSVGRLHISQIDEHKAPEIYLEIYKGSYQRILDQSMIRGCIVLDTVVDSQDKQAL